MKVIRVLIYDGPDEWITKGLDHRAVRAIWGNDDRHIEEIYLDAANEGVIRELARKGNAK